MSVTLALILVPTLCYASAALIYLHQANWPLAIAYSGYAWANLGLMWVDVMLKK